MADESIKISGLSNKKKKGMSNFKIILAIIGIIVLVLGLVAGIILVRENQNISENAQTACTEQCPGADGVLRNCHPPADDGTAQESLCSSAGLISFCGSRNYCCPSAGASWTTNLTLCATAAPNVTPTATATSTATATGSSSPSSTPTPTGSLVATPTVAPTATDFPLPETGASWSTIMGVGVGIVILITSFILVL